MGWTQEEAAARIGLSFRYLAELERSAERNPTIGVLFDVARAYELSVADLVDVEGRKRIDLQGLDLKPPPRGRKPRPKRRTQR
jgi:transcriptional regulator with XRE-family HTH domain